MISHEFFNFGPFFSLKISLLEMLIAVGNEHLKTKDANLEGEIVVLNDKVSLYI